MADISMEQVEGKLKKLMDEAGNDKGNAKVIMDYLRNRCQEDAGMREDVVQEHKTWKRLWKYLYDQASKVKKGNMAVVRDDVVFEWVEDYFRKDDKADAEKEAKRAVDLKSKTSAQKKEIDEIKAKSEKPDSKQVEKKEEPAEKKTPKGQIEGQMDLFSMFGMGEA